VLPQPTDYAAATVLDVEALRRLAGAYYSVTQTLLAVSNWPSGSLPP